MNIHLLLQHNYTRTEPHFPDDKDGHGSQYVASFTIKLSNMADSLRTFYPMLILYTVSLADTGMAHNASAVQLKKHCEISVASHVTWH
jgi:hypothetical protein